MASASEVRERPILFNGPMVKAILEGRKTQTRRMVKPQSMFDGKDGIVKRFPHQAGCPYGKVGDRLWVRETWVEVCSVSPVDGEVNEWSGRFFKRINDPTPRPEGGHYYSGSDIVYRADGEIEFCDGDGFSGDSADKDDMPRWRPSIHMRREFSRITLEITGVRVERLNDISYDDAAAEGVEAWEVHQGCAGCSEFGECLGRREVPGRCETFMLGYKEAFERLWERINGAGSWTANPWVWVIEFRRLEATRG